MKKINLLAMILTVVLLYNACGPMQSRRSTKLNDPNNSNSEDLVFTFENDLRMDNACLDKDEYDACLFFKNPVHQRGSIFSEKINKDTSLQEFLTAGVSIITSSDSSFLDNINIEVQSVTHPRAKKKNDSWKYLYSNDERHFFEQVFVYFWASYATSIIEKQTGVYWGKGQQIKIYLDDAYSGFSPPTNSIHLLESNSSHNLAINADILIHYVGLANLHHANNGQINDLSSDQNHHNCGTPGEPERKSYCCRSIDGCSKALASGIADYFVAMIFPQAPTLGESWSNRLSGLNTCGLSRDLRENNNSTINEAFSVCSNKQMEGHPVAMGSIYASIWWQVRQEAKKEFADGASDIDRLYQQHLKKLDGTDDFLSAYSKILLTDTELFGGKYISKFRAEFRRRGLSVED